MEPLKGAGAAPHDQSKAPGLGRKKKFFAPVFVASVAIALDEVVESGRVQRGDLILLIVFGAGLTWGAAVIEW